MFGVKHQINTFFPNEIYFQVPEEVFKIYVDIILSNR